MLKMKKIPRYSLIKTLAHNIAAIKSQTQNIANKERNKISVQKETTV
jgi:hypothetical protein